MYYKIAAVEDDDVHKKVALVFVTGITDYMQDGCEVEALHYFVKPVDSAKVSYCNTYER